MPLIDVKCQQCKETKEILVKTIPPKHDELTCECGGTLEQISPYFQTSFQLKGTGWFKDGYK